MTITIPEPIVVSDEPRLAAGRSTYGSLASAERYAEIEAAVAEALRDPRWNDPARIARDGFTPDHQSHPNHRRCVGCREPLASHAGKPLVSHGWTYGSRECHRSTALYRAVDDPAWRAGAAR